MKKQLIIVAIKGQTTRPIFGPVLPEIAQSKKKYFESMDSWKGWTFQLRTLEGYKHIKILPKKRKTEKDGN